MKVIILLWLLLLVSPVFGELTKEDIEAIRTIVNEEGTALEKRMKEYIDLKIDGVNARIDGVEKSLNAKIDAVEKSLNARIDGVEKSLNARIDGVEKSLNARIDDMEKSLIEQVKAMWLVVLALIGLITAAIAIPQLIIAYKERGRKDLEAAIQQLREQLNTPQPPSS